MSEKRGMLQDRDAIRAQLRHLNEELKRVEAERITLLEMEKGFMGWLRLHDAAVEEFRE